MPTFALWAQVSSHTFLQVPTYHPLGGGFVTQCVCCGCPPLPYGLRFRHIHLVSAHRPPFGWWLCHAMYFVQVPASTLWVEVSLRVSSHFCPVGKSFVTYACKFPPATLWVAASLPRVFCACEYPPTTLWVVTSSPCTCGCPPTTLWVVVSPLVSLQKISPHPRPKHNMN